MNHADTVPDTVDPNTGMQKNTGNGNGPNPYGSNANIQVANTERVYKIRVNNYSPAIAENLTVEYHIYVQTAITSDDGSVKPSVTIKDVTQTETVTVPANSKIEFDAKKVTFGNKMVPVRQTQNNNYYGNQPAPKYIRTVTNIMGLHIVVKQGDAELTNKDDPFDVVSKVDQINKRNEAIKNGTSIF